jgi:hypothetical protein
MLPKNNTYGEWPNSGEIDIVQSRGNDITYKQGGNNVIASCLHFGPNAALDGWWRNNVKSTAYRETFSDRFHKFGVEVRTRILCVIAQPEKLTLFSYSGPTSTSSPTSTRASSRSPTRTLRSPSGTTASSQLLTEMGKCHLKC